jgi:hypothetical protein
MKNTIIISIILLFICSCSKMNNSKLPQKLDYTEVVFLNSDDDFPMPVSKKEFWSNDDGLEKIIIYGKQQNSILSQKLDLLKNTNTTMKNYDFYHRVAFIRKYENKKTDTIYTEPLFKYWKINKEIYVDTSGYFKRSFSSFLLH